MPLRNALVACVAFTIVFLIGHTASAYDLVGVTDRAGKTIVPCQYAKVEYLKQGYFLLFDENTERPSKPSYKAHLVDMDGNPVSLKIPPACTLSRVFIPEAETKSVSDKSLPADTILEIHSPKGLGLSNMVGEILLEPAFERIDRICENYFAVSKEGSLYPGTLLFTLNAKNGTRVKAPANIRIDDTQHGDLIAFTQEGEEGRRGYLTKSGELAIPAKFVLTGQFSAEGFATITLAQNGNYAYINTKGDVISPIYEMAEGTLSEQTIVGLSKNNEIKYGIVNKKFEEILPLKYCQFRRLSNDIFAVQDDPKNAWKIISGNGEELLTLPPGMDGVYGDNSDWFWGTIHDPTGKSRTVWFKRTGKNIVQSDEASVPVPYGMKVLSKKESGKPRQYEIVDAQGNVIQPFQNANLWVVTADRILKILPQEHFSKARWDDPAMPYSEGGSDRTEQFRAFLNDYNLIGMLRTEVTAILGPPSSEKNGVESYSISAASCGNSFDDIEIEYAQDKVLRWREISRIGGIAHEGAWIKENVLLADDDDGDLGEGNNAQLQQEFDLRMRLIPKGVGK